LAGSQVFKLRHYCSDIKQVPVENLTAKKAMERFVVQPLMIFIRIPHVDQIHSNEIGKPIEEIIRSHQSAIFEDNQFLSVSLKKDFKNASVVPRPSS
jgi:hypothetical protein